MSIIDNIPERDLPVKSPSGAAMLRYVESGKSYSGALSDVIGPIDDRIDALSGSLGDAISGIDDRIDVLEISQGDGVPGVANYADIATLFPSPTAGQQVDVLTDSDPAKVGRWGYIGGVWVKSADRVSALEGKMPIALSVSQHAYKSSVLQSLGLGNKWDDFDFSGVASYNGTGAYTLEQSSSRAVLLMITGYRSKQIPANAVAEIFSVAVTVLGKGAGSGLPRVLVYQGSGSGEITGTRQTFILPANATTSPIVVAFEGLQQHVDAQWIAVHLDAGLGGNVRFTEPSVVDGPVAGFVAYERAAPLRINQFVDPDFVGNGIDGSQNAGSQIITDGRPTLELPANPLFSTAIRSYYLPASGVLAPGTNLRVMVEALSDTATGGEVAVLFRNSSGSEIAGSRLTLRTSEAGVWNGLDGNTIIPTAATQVQVRITLWADATGATFAWFRKLWLFSNDSGGSVDESKVLSNVRPGQSSTKKTLYVNGLTGDDGNTGAQVAPLKTVAAAIAALGGTGSVIVQAGDIAPVNLSAAVNIRISADLDARVRIMGGTRISGGITKTAGQSKVYQVALAAAPVGSTANWVWHHEAPEAPIPAGEHHAVQNGRTHRLPSTRLQQVASVAAIDAASGPSWYWSGGTLYFSIAGGGDATGATLYVPSGSDGVSAGVGAHVEISGIEAWYCGNGFNLKGCRSYRLHGCRAFGSRRNGFVRDGAFGVEVACEAGGSGNDGFGTHNTLGSPNAARTHGLFIDQWSHDNGGDGCSEHERCDATYLGGMNEYNGDRGMATSYGANVRVHGMTSRKNGHADPSGGEGFGVVGVVNPANDAGVGSQMLCVGCVSDGDRYGFRAAGGNLIAQDCKTFSAVTAAYNALSGHRLELIDCSDSGSTVVKSGSGVITVRNTSPVT